MKKVILFWVVSCFGIVSHAGKITEQQAYQKVQSYIASKKFSCSRRSDQAQIKLNRIAVFPSLYIFNVAEEGGFVIISNDDRFEGILGYSDSGQIDADNIPENLRWWLSTYESQCPQTEESNVRTVALNNHSPISPMITTKWNQNAPYNLQTPVKGGRRTVTGCVATAMAQLMYYMRCPDGIMPQDLLIHNNEVLPSTTFNWDIIKEEYSEDDSDESAQEVAKLMRYAGYSCKTSYGIDESIASYINATEALRTRFGLSKTTDIVYRSAYTASEWDDIIYQELAKGRPIMYNGSNSNDKGHAFICDGYDGNGLYHFNWGWGGTGDGFFRLSLIDTNKIADAPDYNRQQSAIIGIQKGSELATQSRLYIRSVSGWIERNEIVGKDMINTRVLTARWDGTSPNLNDVVYGYDIYSGNELIETAINTPIVLDNKYKIGQYKIKTLYRVNGVEEWVRPIYYDAKYLSIEKKENSISCSEVNAEGYVDMETSYEVTDVELKGVCRQDARLTIVAKVKNLGTKSYGDFAIRIRKADSESWGVNPISRAGAGIDPGQTEVVAFHLIPETAGEFYFGIFARTAVSSYSQKYYLLKEFPLSVAAPASYTISVDGKNIYNEKISLKFKTPSGKEYDQYCYKLPDSKCNISLFVKNEGPDEYDWPVHVALKGFNLNNETVDVKNISREVFVLANESKEVKLAFEDLKSDIAYHVLFSYKKVDPENIFKLENISWLNEPETPYFMWVKNNTYTDVPIVISGDPIKVSTGIYDLQGRRIEKPKFGQLYIVRYADGARRVLIRDGIINH